MQAVAEQSKNAILSDLLVSSSNFANDIVNTVTNTSITLAVILSVILLLLISITLIIFFYLGIISSQKAVIAFAVSFIYIVIMFIVFVRFTEFYSRKRLNNAIRIFNNFIASENVLIIINGTAEAYNAART
jgi:hypothetical protein